MPNRTKRVKRVMKGGSIRKKMNKRSKRPNRSKRVMRGGAGYGEAEMGGGMFIIFLVILLIGAVYGIITGFKFVVQIARDLRDDWFPEEADDKGPITKEASTVAGSQP